MAKTKIAAKGGLSASRARADEARHLMNTYKRPPIVFTRGRGCHVYDSTGREYLDFLAGIAVNALGHAHPRLVGTIRREAGRAIHTSNLFHNPFQGPLAKKLANRSGLDRVFFTNSGQKPLTELSSSRERMRTQRPARAAVAMASPRKRQESSRSRIRFTVARSAPFRSRTRQNIANPLLRSFPGRNS